MVTAIGLHWLGCGTKKRDEELRVRPFGPWKIFVRFSSLGCVH